MTKPARPAPPETAARMPDLRIPLRRDAREPIAAQISAGLRAAMRDGRLAPNARLPSWRDFAAQLGVARGTVRLAYERLIDEGLAVALGAAGTRVVQRPPPVAAQAPADGIVTDDFATFSPIASAFQMGVPAHDAFPAQVWSRTVARAARASAGAPLVYPDPRGLPALRTEIAAHLAIARGLSCQPAQVFVTSGYASALSLVVHALGATGSAAWVEDPGYPLARRALGLLGIEAVPVPVDREGIDVARGIARAPHAALALVTPGQQAPLGVALSPRRRAALLDWAARSRGWIVEDDYLSELQLQGRAVPALGARERDARVLHIGSFSKTLSPALRLGFLVVPPGEAERFTRAAAVLSPSSSPLMQLALSGFMREGHYLRHLRRMKRLYLSRRDALTAALDAVSASSVKSGLSVLLQLPPGLHDDVALAQAARAHAMSPSPLSPWYAGPGPAHAGLVLGVTNLPEDSARATCERLMRLIAQHA